MTGGRSKCAAAPLWRDSHMATGRRWQVTDPDGREFAVCGAACLVTFATRAALPADIESIRADDTEDAAFFAGLKF